MDHLREMRRRLRAVLEELEVPEPLNVPNLAARVGTARGRPVRLRYCEFDYAFGTVFPAPSEYLIVYHGRGESECNHVICHDLAHIFLGDLDEGGPPFVCGFPPSEAVDRRRDRAFRMSGTGREWRAETAATILCEWIAPVGRKQKPSVDAAVDDPVLARLDRAFADIREWR